MNRDHLITAMTLAASVGSGVVGGVFFAFSTFVMKALGKIAPPAGLAAMQAINVVVLNPLFLGVFMGTAALCLAAIAVAAVRWGQPAALWLIAGGLLYLVGTFGVTVAANVPRNDALAAVQTDDPQAAQKWADYNASWTTWNHVRTAAAIAAAGSFAMALRN